MSSTTEPPDLDDVVVRVNAALDELDVVDGPERDALVSSLRAALGALGPVDVHDIEVRAVPVEAPAVEVVEGGRASAEPSAGPRPPLRVAPPGPAEGDADDDNPAEAERRQARRRAVRVVRVGQAAPTVVPPGSGRILLAAGEWQTVFAGLAPQTYRLECRAGRLGLYTEGEPVCELRAGQCVDVEASFIRVNAEQGADGWYTRLDG